MRWHGLSMHGLADDLRIAPSGYALLSEPEKFEMKCGEVKV